MSPQPQTADPWADLTGDTPLKATTSSEYLPSLGNPWADLVHDEPQQKPYRQVSTPEASLRGIGAGVTVGAAPWLAGLSAAAGTPELSREEDLAQMDPTTGMTPNSGRFVGGAFNMIKNWVSDHPDPEVQKSYEKGRDDYREADEASFGQHPLAYFLGMMGGALVGPKFGGIKPAAVGGRTIQGMRAGGLGGATYGANKAISEGKDLPETIEKAGEGAGLGIALGGPLNAAFGPRAVNAASSGSRAAEFAERELNAPIPRGLASDNRGINAASSAVRSLPWFGARMSSALDKTQEAAGEYVADIAGGMRGAAADRAGANAAVKPGLQAVVDANKQTQNDLYNTLRSQIDENAKYSMPNTKAAVDKIKAQRAGRGIENPEAGLEQFENVSTKGSTFNDAHGARQDARPTNPTVANPGIDAGEYKYLTAAMTKDIRDMVQAAGAAKGTSAGPLAARANAGRALASFNEAETKFGPLAEQNRTLQDIVESGGESGIATLLNASREKGGNLQLLNQLRAKMPPDQFQVVGGQLLSELGQSKQTGGFSLNQFVTNWNKVSDGAKSALFDPQQRANIDKVFNLGSQIKGAMRDVNTSHTSNTIILFDLARDAAMLGVGLGTGAVTAAGTVTGGAAMAPGVLFAHWVSSPAKVASMAAWSSAYQSAVGAPTPARMAVFNAATRNLSHNLGIPPDRIMQAVHARITGAAAQDDQNSGLQQ